MLSHCKNIHCNRRLLCTKICNFFLQKNRDLIVDELFYETHIRHLKKKRILFSEENEADMDGEDSKDRKLYGLTKKVNRHT